MSYEYKVNIAGVEYGMEDISAGSITQGLFETMSVGSAVSAELELTVWVKEPIPRMAEIKPYVREVGTSDWKPLGVFYIDTRYQKGKKLEIVANDAMIRAEMIWEPDQSLVFPMTMQNAVNIIADLLGVEVDTRTVMNPAYTIDYPIGYSMRNVLSYIAAAYGGNWMITREGKLLLVPLFPVENEQNRVWDIENNVKDFEKYDNITVTGVRLKANSKTEYTSGDTESYAVEVNCPYGTRQMADDLLVKLRGKTYHGFNAGTVWLPTEAELGNYIVLDNIKYGLYYQKIRFGSSFASEISAPGEKALEHEYQYMTPIEREISNSENRTMSEARSLIEKSETSILLQVESRVETVGKEVENLQNQVEYASSKAESAASEAQTARQELANYADKVKNSLEDLQDQIDGAIETWFFDYVPTTSNIPAVNWKTEDEKNRHLGDLFYIVDNEEQGGLVYRWTMQDGAYFWQLIEDTELAKALQLASEAKDTADGKRRTFLVQPTPPYDVGDIWMDGTDIKACVNARSSGQFLSSDWQVRNEYAFQGDVTAVTERVSKLEVNQDGIFAQVSETEKKTQALSEDMIVSTQYEFYQSDSATTLTGGSWSATLPKWEQGKFAWQRILVTYGDGHTEYQPSQNGICITGNTGTPGTQGINLVLDSDVEHSSSAYLVYRYTLSTPFVARQTYTLTLWGTLAEEKTRFDAYTNYTSTRIGSLEKVSDGVYKLTFTLSANLIKNEGDANYLRIYQYPNSVTDVTSTIQKIKLEIGEVENPVWTPAPQDLVGRSVTGSTVMYQAGTSGTTPPIGTWSATIPTVPDGQYLWIRTVYTYSDNTQSDPMYSVSRNGSDGKDGKAGDTGADGRGITSVTPQYYLSTSNTAQQGGSWAATIPAYVSGRYYWTRSQIVWNNPTETTYTAAVLDNALTDANRAALEANDKVDNLEVGGRNYLLNPYRATPTETRATWDYDVATGTYTVTVQNTGGFQQVYFRDIFSDIEAIRGQVCTLSVADYECSDPSLRYRVCLNNSGTSYWLNLYSGDKKRTLTIPENITDSAYLMLRADQDSNAPVGTTLVVRGIKLELGSVATDWTPAPEDVEGGITDAKQAAQEANDKIDSLEVGGRNLLLNSGTPVSNTTYNMVEYLLAEIPVEGETYTLQIKGTLGEGHNYFMAYNSSGLSGDHISLVGSTSKDGFGPPDANGVYRATFKWRNTSGSTTVVPKYIRVYQYPSSGKGASEIEWVKLEKGNMATDWTPAPEDVEEQINDAQASVQETIREMSTSLTATAQEMILSALSSYVQTGDYDEFRQRVEASLSLLSDQLTIRFTETAEQISNVNGEMQSWFEQYSKYFRFTANGLTIGAEGNELELRLDNDMIEFLKNDQRVSYWDGNYFHTGNIMVDVTERAQFGNFAFVPRSDGSLSFLKVVD